MKQLYYYCLRIVIDYHETTMINYYCLRIVIDYHEILLDKNKPAATHWVSRLSDSCRSFQEVLPTGQHKQ